MITQAVRVGPLLLVRVFEPITDDPYGNWLNPWTDRRPYINGKRSYRVVVQFKHISIKTELFA